MGYFYTGFDYKNRKNGYLKIGETGQKYLSQRLQVIQHYDSFECLGYLILKNETLSERRLVESYVRVMMERVDGLTQTQNDHYTYVISGNKYEQAHEYAEIALAYATAFCEQLGIEYERGTKKYKRK